MVCNLIIYSHRSSFFTLSFSYWWIGRSVANWIFIRWEHLRDRAIGACCISSRIEIISFNNFLKWYNAAIAIWFVGTAGCSTAAYYDIIALAIIITSLFEDGDSIAALECIHSSFIYSLHGFTWERWTRCLYTLIHLRWWHPVLSWCNISDPLTVLDTNNLAALLKVSLAFYMIFLLIDKIRYGPGSIESDWSPHVVRMLTRTNVQIRRVLLLFQESVSIVLFFFQLRYFNFLEGL